jgi:glycine C-acetyltransferase
MAAGIAFPTSPEGKARIRATMNSEHRRKQLEQALETFQRVAKRMGLLLS